MNVKLVHLNVRWIGNVSYHMLYVMVFRSVPTILMNPFKQDAVSQNLCSLFPICLMYVYRVNQTFVIIRRPCESCDFTRSNCL